MSIDTLSVYSGPHGDIYFRGDTRDIDSIQQVQWTKGVGIKPGETVMDIGAHIGCFTRTVALPAGAQVIAVEADPENVAVLRRNTEGWPVEVVHAAVTRAGSKAVLYHSPTNPKSHSLYIKDKRRTAVEVPAVQLPVLLAKYRPSVLKIDIEGAEHEIGLNHPLPAYVRALAFEIHIDETKSRAWWRQSAAEIVDALVAGGFKPDQPVDLDEKRWIRGPGGWYTTCRIERCWTR